MTNNRADYEAKFQMLVEDYLSNVEEANRNGRLLPAWTVIDQLGRCRRHNFNRRDRALLGQVQLARNSRSTQWLDIAARDARAISMWDHAWIRHNIHSRNHFHRLGDHLLFEAAGMLGDRGEAAVMFPWGSLCRPGLSTGLLQLLLHREPWTFHEWMTDRDRRAATDLQ